VVTRCIQELGAEIAPSSDIVASASYRKSMAQVLLQRALRHVSA